VPKELVAGHRRNTSRSSQPLELRIGVVLLPRLNALGQNAKPRGSPYRLRSADGVRLEGRSLPLYSGRGFDSSGTAGISARRPRRASLRPSAAGDRASDRLV